MTKRRGAQTEPRLELSLLANGGEQARLYRGEPLILSVLVTDQEAARAAAHDETIADAREDVDRREANGEISAAMAKRERAPLRTGRVKAMKLGSKRAPWARQIRFKVASGRRVVTWRVEVLSNPAPPPAVTLPAGRVAVADFTLRGDDLRRVKPGTYVAWASLPAGSKPVVSEPVEVTITSTNARGKDRLRVAIGSARLAYRTGSLEAAQEQIERALRLDPHSIDALVLHADIAVARGRHDVALTSLERALVEFEAQHPGSYEPPAPILRRLSEVQRKLFPGAGDPDPLEGAPPLG